MKSKRGKFAIKRGYAVTFETDSFYLFPSLLADFIAVYIFSVYIRDTCEATYPPLSNSRWKKGLGRNRRGRRGRIERERDAVEISLGHRTLRSFASRFYRFLLAPIFPTTLEPLANRNYQFSRETPPFPVAPSRSIECNNFVNYYLDQRWIEILQFCFEQSY